MAQIIVREAGKKVRRVDLADKGIRHLPVFEGDKLVGVISMGDVVKAIIAEQKFIIDQLKSFHAYDM